MDARAGCSRKAEEAKTSQAPALRTAFVPEERSVLKVGPHSKTRGAVASVHGGARRNSCAAGEPGPE